MNIYFLSHDIYFLSHDIQHVLYLVLSYGEIHVMITREDCIFWLLLLVRPHEIQYAEPANVLSILVYKVITCLHWVSSSSLESPVSLIHLCPPVLALALAVWVSLDVL